MTPLWAELAGQSPDAAAAVRAGEKCQVSCESHTCSRNSCRGHIHSASPLKQLLGRMGTEAECGQAAIYLAADAAFCTGIDLLLSGGAELDYGEKSQPPS